MIRWRCAYIGLGSNLDDPAAQVSAALRLLRAAPWSRCLQVSRLYGSRPLDGSAQPDYCNAVAALLTPLTPEELLSELHGIEALRGRPAQRERWSARPIDLDLLSCGEERRDTGTLRLPHPGIVQRNFVLYPWAELAPDLWLPGMGRVGALARQLPGEGLWMLGEIE